MSPIVSIGSPDSQYRIVWTRGCLLYPVGSVVKTMRPDAAAVLRPQGVLRDPWQCIDEGEDLVETGLALVDEILLVLDVVQHEVALQTLAGVNVFNDVWNAGLVLFGLHLLLIGYLTYRSGFVPEVLAVLIALAGGGYIYDSFAQLLTSGACAGGVVSHVRR